MTNFSWHWHGEEPSEDRERFLVLPWHCPAPRPTDRIWPIVEEYGALPKG